MVCYGPWAFKELDMTFHLKMAENYRIRFSKRGGKYGLHKWPQTHRLLLDQSLKGLNSSYYWTTISITEQESIRLTIYNQWTQSC